MTMTEKELKKLSRTDLLEMLIEQSRELEETREKLAAAEEELDKKEIMIDQAGSIAEASLQLNGIFEAAQASAKQYLDNIALLNERQSAICEQLEQESREKADACLAEAKKQSEKMETETKIQCAEMTKKAKAESQAYWEEISAKLDSYYEQHTGIREMLSIVVSKQK